MKILRAVFFALLLLTSLTAVAGDLLSGMMGSFFGVDVDEKSCEDVLKSAQKATEDYQGKAQSWGGKLIDKWIGHKFHTLSDLTETEGLSVTGLFGRFLGDRRIDALTMPANKVLAKIFENPVMTEQLGRQMVRLGILSHSEKNQEFANWYILSYNEEIDLSMPKVGGIAVEDDVIVSYLEKLRETNATKGGTTDIMMPESARNRVQHLFEMVRIAFNELDPSGDEKAQSLKSFDMALNEIGRLDRMHRLTANSFDEIFDQMVSSAQYKIPRHKIPSWVRAIAETPLPCAKAILGTFIVAYDYGERLFYEESKASTDRHELTVIDRRHVRQPGTLRVWFGKRDFKNLMGNVQALISKYGQGGGPDVFTDAFATDFLAAYPEVQEYFVEFYTNEKMVSHPVAGETFAAYHQEVRKVLTKAANFFAILRLDHAVFPNLTDKQLLALRSTLVSDLGLVDADGSLNTNRIDVFLTSFATTALGKARNALIDSLSEEFAINDVAGNFDYNRRALYLLHHYKSLSYAFSRQNQADQKFLTEIMDQNYQAGLSELLKLEAPEPSFEILRDLEGKHLNFLFYQFLLSESKERQHHMTISSHTLTLWMSLKDILAHDSLNPSAVAVYNTYVSWLAQKTNLDMTKDWDRVVLRMVAITGIPHSKIPLLQQAMQRLQSDESTRNLYLQLMDRSPVFFHRANDLFAEILIENAVENLSLMESIDDYLDVFTKILLTIKSDRFSFARISNAEQPIRLYLRPVIEALQEDTTTPKNLKLLEFKHRHYEYGEVIHAVEKQ
jgi:hypothetical protein